MLILVDQDGPLADIDAAIADGARRGGIGPVPYDVDNYRSFYAADNWTRRWGPSAGAFINGLVNTPGFYRTLPVVDGAREGLEKLEAAGHTVRICSSPRRQNPSCASDKLAWADEHLGDGWGAKTILTRDKTLVCGHYLIDDRPAIAGIGEPSWDHIIWDAPYNQTNGPWVARLNGWADIDRLLDELARLQTP